MDTRYWEYESYKHNWELGLIKICQWTAFQQFSFTYKKHRNLCSANIMNMRLQMLS